MAASVLSFASPIVDAAAARARRLRGARARFATRDEVRDGSIRAAVARMMRQSATRGCDARDARSGILVSKSTNQPTKRRDGRAAAKRTRDANKCVKLTRMTRIRICNERERATRERER